MADEYKIKLTPSYLKLRSFYLNAEVMQDERITPGLATVRVNGRDVEAEGRLNARGFLSGMAAIHHALSLTSADELVARPAGENVLVIEPPERAAPQPEETTTTAYQSVFERERLHHVFIEPFRAENLNTWIPTTETDVYLAFGVLQDYTDFQYCCGASQSVLNRLGADYNDRAKPDAILIDRITGRYLMAEWKKNSSHFRVNHQPNDVDVLVCWLDDETNRESLPHKVLALHDVAREAAATAFEG